MRSWMIAACVAALTAGAVGCGGGYEIADGDLSGTVHGQDWKFVTGWTDDFLSDDKDFFTSLYDVEAEACGFTADTERGLLLNVPRTEGEYELSFSQNVTFYMNSDNKIATTGKMVVESISDTEIEVGLYAMFDDDNEVSGHFTATVCPPSP